METTTNYNHSNGIPPVPPQVLGLAQRGCKLFPVQSHGKLPLIKEWPAKASNDANVIGTWLHEHPGCNWGLATGQPSGCFVVDVDGPEGETAVKALSSQGKRLPQTMTVKTGRGWHFYYRLPEGIDIRNNQNAKIADHIDIRGTGGFVVAPGSTHQTGVVYDFWGRVTEPANPPQWLIDKLILPSVTAQPQPTGTATSGTLSKGSRTNTLVSLAGSMNRRGMSPAAIEAALLADNAARCVPPLPEDKVRQIAHDIPKRYPQVSEAEWTEPEPLNGELPPVLAFDPELLPDALRPMVEDIAERMQVPIDLPAVASLATLAGATNRRALIQPKANDTSWTVVPNLWGAIIAPPGFMKSPVITAAIAPLKSIEKEWMKRNAQALADFEAAQERAELDKQTWREQYKAAQKAKKELPIRPESTVEEPTPARLVTNDVTYEKLHETLSQNPAGIFLYRDELSGWLGSLERPGREGERAFFLEAWSGDGSYTLERIGRGSVHADSICTSLFGGIQPARFRSYLADALRDGPTNDGLVQRFQLLVWPDMDSDWRWTDSAPNAIAIARAEAVYRRLAGMDASNPLRLQFTADAQTFFIDWLTELEHKVRSDETSDVMRAHLSKYRKLMPALALLLSLADGEDQAVGLPHTRKAAALCEYLESHASRVYCSRTHPAQLAAITLSQKLAKGWKRSEGEFSLRDVYQNGWSGLAVPDDVRGAMRVLEDVGWVRSKPLESTLGRPSEIYVINPRLEGHRDEPNKAA